MESALEKSAAFILFILIGIVLKSKFTQNDEVRGLKKIILNVALPATIFIALLKIKIETALLLLPLLALSLNVLLFLCAPYLLSLLGISKNSATGRTARLLIPSLAPGLSCFPFILEFLGDAYLAKAAMADLGNKLFVLFILYIIAIRWHYQNRATSKESMKNRIQSLLKTMFTEPVNLFIFAALILVAFGINLAKLPIIISETFNRLSLTMTPLVLLFIGLSVKFKRDQFLQIFSLLLSRAALILILVSSFLMLSGLNAPQDILLTLCFSLSACSFWPFAHISIVHNKEQGLAENQMTFQFDYAIAILALSLPISVSLILIILTCGHTFTHIPNILLLAGFLLSLALLPILFSRLMIFLKAKRQTNPL